VHAEAMMVVDQCWTYEVESSLEHIERQEDGFEFKEIDPNNSKRHCNLQAPKV